MNGMNCVLVQFFHYIPGSARSRVILTDVLRKRIFWTKSLGNIGLRKNKQVSSLKSS